MMMRLVIVWVMLVMIACGTALAQGVGAPTPSPLGATSPLGIGPAAPVASPGIPLGATELPSPGLSPTAGAATNSACFGSGSAMTGTSEASASTALFDGGIASGPTSTNCGVTPPSFAQPTASASSPTGMVVTPVRPMQIPFGATELGGGGLSPLPPSAAAPTSTTQASSISAFSDASAPSAAFGMAPATTTQSGTTGGF
jgi:hypothetical protein